MDKAKSNGYTGDDYKNQLGFILDGTNYYSVIFREDFAKAIFGKGKVRATAEEHGSFGYHGPEWMFRLSKIAESEDKWKYLEENVNFND